jgi:phenylpyruvate tautomerase PptA (4-oxalocrotonate tautomerase family)
MWEREVYQIVIKGNEAVMGLVEYINLRRWGIGWKEVVEGLRRGFRRKGLDEK